MKLFKTIAATAAVITCCIGNPLPAEARNGWEYQGKYYKTGESVYRRFLGCDGAICKYEFKMSSWTKSSVSYIDCNNWKYLTAQQWHDIMPQSNEEHYARRICR